MALKGNESLAWLGANKTHQTQSGGKFIEFGGDFLFETGTAQRYFSPNYAAPEQLTGAPTGVACDVYSLGLLLYELLSGTRPFDFSGLSAGQIEPLITHRIPFQKAQDAYDLVLDHPEASLGMVFDWAGA